MPRLNIQADVRAYLEENLDGVDVCVRVPDPRPTMLVVVKRSGGRKLNVLQDRPGLDVLMWAPSEAAVAELAERVGDLMERLPRTRFIDGYDLVVEETMRSDPDPETDIPRWYASYTITTHKY